MACDDLNRHSEQLWINVPVYQTVSSPLVMRAWSKARKVTGAPDANYAIMVDVEMANGVTESGYFMPFSIGTHSWELKQAMIVPSHPVVSARYLLHIIVLIVITC